MKTFLVASGIVAFLGISALVADVKTDYDHSADFRALRTYSWIKVDAGDSLWSDRIRQAVDQQMSAKGMTRQESGGDVALAAIGRT